MNFSFSFFPYSFSFNISKMPMYYVTGITNITSDRKFIAYADYDNTNLEQVEIDVEMMQKEYDIGDAIIVCSSEQNVNKNNDFYGNYHVIPFTKINFSELKKILKELRCDMHFKFGWKYQQRGHVLRISEKKDIKTKSVIKSKPFLVSLMTVKKCKRIYSKAHVEFFEKYYNFKINKAGKKFDKSENVSLIDYVTR